jgi:hypothetical protein
MPSPLAAPDMAEMLRMQQAMSKFANVGGLAGSGTENKPDRVQIQPSELDVAPPGYISYEEAAQRLGMTVDSFRASTYRRFQNLKTGRRAWVRSEDVDAVLAERGEIAAKRKTFREATYKRVGAVRDGHVASGAVAIFRNGGSILDAVEKLHLTFEVAEAAWNNYQKFAAGGSTSVSIDPQAASVLASMLDWKPPHNGQTLIAAIVNYMQAHPAAPLTESEKAVAQAQQKESP